MKLVDLFAGTGAFSLAFHEFNVETVFANDFVKESEQIYNQNNKTKLTNKDLNQIDISNIPNHDILTFGISCQPFSIAGKQKGFDDPRAKVFNKVYEILENKKPKYFIMENVKNLLSHNKNQTFKTILNAFAKYGYYTKYKVLNTKTITGIPQNRERIYIVGFLDKNECDKFSLDFPEIKVSKICKFLEKNVDEKYYYKPCSKIYETLKENVTNKNSVYQYRRVYVRENKQNVCPTLTANMGTGGHNVPIIKDENGIRKLTPRECFNLQGFPENYELSGLSDSKLYKLAGNAVSLPIVKLIAERILNFN